MCVNLLWQVVHIPITDAIATLQQTFIRWTQNERQQWSAVYFASAAVD